MDEKTQRGRTCQLPNTKIGVQWQDRSDWRKKSGESTRTKSQKKKNGFKTVVVGGGGGKWGYTGKGNVKSWGGSIHWT